MEKNFKEIFSSFDLIDEIIYIADMDTYELVYCNQRTRDDVFAGEDIDLQGKKCYSCLQGLDHPCVFCNNDELKKKKRCIWSRQHPRTGKYYLIHDSVINVDGKDYRLELAVDATHIEEAATHTREMLDMETHLTNCVRHLVKSGDFADSVGAVLQTVLNFYGGERAYLFDIDQENEVSSNTHEICAPGILPQIDNLQNVPLEKMRFWIEYFADHSALIIKDLEEIKDDPNRQDEYQDLKAQGISSIIVVPIMMENELNGFVGVDNPKLNFNNSDFLLNLAYFLGAEIGKIHMVRELQDLSFHDALTGVYNRKGFEQIIANHVSGNQPIGFAMVDVDNFKRVNDTYGHAVGDEILKETANMLGSIFRSNDSVFRLGGDEFGVLLTNCGPSAWKTICTKIQWIHSALAEKYQEMAVTLSVGICFAEKDYSETIYQLADKAMYETKRNGRAGCTMIDEKTGEKRFWNDDKISFYSRKVLEFNNTGLFRVEYPLEQENAARMICSDIVKEMLAFPDDMSPEECYQQWLTRIDPSYLDALSKARKKLLTEAQAECTYLWNHPEFGKIFIRTTGTGILENGIQILRGYHHSLKETMIVEREDESQLLLETISSIYFGSYYINLQADTYFTIKNAPNERYLQVQEKDAQESLHNFISVLVRQDDREKMMAFVDLQTLPQRMKADNHLDCEYVSVAERSWCRATFIPAKYDQNGEMTHVVFLVAPLDADYALESEKNARNKKTIESLYNHVPGGLVMYEWNGSQLKTLHISKYYEEQYGDTLISSEGENVGGPDFQRIHPDDVEDYKKAIENALIKTHYLEYVYRAWNNIQKRYVWVKLNAVAETQPNGTTLVYAMYSDVTGQKEAELRLWKKQVTLAASLDASNQLCYEYDPLTHREECLTEDRIFHLPKVIENYPEAMIERNLIHPEDKVLFRETVRRMEDGLEAASCDIRFLREGKYGWFTCSFRTFYDEEKERNVILLTLIDITEHMNNIQNYKARMQIMMGVTQEALSFGTMNLTENTFSALRVQAGIREITQKVHTLDELFQMTVKNVVGEKQQEEYRKLFTRENLLAMMEKGHMSVRMEHMYQMSATHIEWVCTCVDMLKNPSTGDAVGVCYSKSVQNEKVTNILLEKTLQLDYPLAAVVYAETGDYYLFQAETEEYCVHKENFWEDISDNLLRVVDPDLIEQVKDALTKEEVLQKMSEQDEFYYAFDSESNGVKCRLEARFYYLDETRETILATLRDITDSIIMEKLRHDNERDHLTNLYNRRKIFAECQKLLNEHPEDQFAMLHFDIKHFRLYNTFFGDAAGDKLLCDISDMFRKMDSDYDYWAYGRIESDVFCVFFPISQNKYQKHLHDLLHGLQDYRTDFLIEPAIGIYTVTNRSMSIESMFTRASIAAKTVRSGVTNSVIFYDENMEQKMLDEQQVVNEMFSAIEKEQFHVYLQPKYSLYSNKPAGAEALVRWIHPQKGLFSPAKFIPVFERNGFIATLDRYMWEHVCMLLRKWLDAGYAIYPVSVNVSRISMYSPTTVQFLKDLVTKYGIEPRYLELELTESAYMDDPTEMKKQLRDLQEFGFHILMDDFGSGYSSLNTLRELPVDVLKLDMKFLSESGTDERGRLVLASIVRMSRLLKLTIVAEGVETPEQAEFLRGLGCEYVQGYLFARPMPAEEYEQILVKYERNMSEMPDKKESYKSRLCGDVNAQSQVIEDVFPSPITLVEYGENRFVFLRVNAAFLEEFEVSEAGFPSLEKFQEHLSGQGFEQIQKACTECVNTKKQVRFSVDWIDREKKKHRYCGRVAYEGASTDSHMLVIAFMEVE